MQATFTAAQIAAALGIRRQSVQKRLNGISPAGVKVIRGNEAAAWTLEQLPPALVEIIETARVKGGYRTQMDVITNPPRRIPLPALDAVDPSEIERAAKLRDAFLPSLSSQHKPGVSAREWKLRGVEEYRRVFGHAIGPNFWWTLFKRIVANDAGAENWNNLQIYLPEKPKIKPGEPAIIAPPPAAEFENLGVLMASLRNPLDPGAEERKAVWAIALKEYAAMVSAGASEKAAGRKLRDHLFTHAKFLAPTRRALRAALDRKLAAWIPGNPQSLSDGRASNGDKAEYPRQDIRRLRHSAVLKNGGRVDAAWREEYKLLSDYTRQRHPCSVRCPRALYNQVNRINVNALVKRYKGRRALRNLVGGIRRDASDILSMARWAVDDWTSNIEVALQNPDGTWSLIQPQIITVMDFASRKWVGWSASNDKGPTAQLTCAAILDGFKRHGVPAKLVVENGFVFGKSLNIHGKVDDQGRSIVAGLAQYGCTIHNFDKMSPTSKGELEKSFDMVQRQMERHAGYAGRLQMLDASDDFKREQRLIRSGHVDARKHRYTFDEFISKVLPGLIDEYNATPQHGHLSGISPNEAFEARKNPNDPPIKFDNHLQWMLANERYRVTVQAGGVIFRHYGQKIQVRGGELPEYAGQELWALVDRADSSLVTFMTLDHSKTFTVETCRQPSADEPRIATGESVLAAEIKKRGAHERAVSVELDSLKKEYGNPRLDLLAQIRGQTPALSGVADETTRRVILNSRIQNSGAQLEAQRADITARRKQSTTNKARARRNGIPAELVTDDDESRRALELLGGAPLNPSMPNNGEVAYYLKPSAGGQAKYVDYLVTRLVEFRRAGQKSFGQTFTGQITFGTVKKIAQSQLACNIHAPSRFDEVCAHLKAAIDATILGKRNAAKGAPNYHEFAKPQETQ